MSLNHLSLSCSCDILNLHKKRVVSSSKKHTLYEKGNRIMKKLTKIIVAVCVAGGCFFLDVSDARYRRSRYEDTSTKTGITVTETAPNDVKERRYFQDMDDFKKNSPGFFRRARKYLKDRSNGRKLKTTVTITDGNGNSETKVFSNQKDYKRNSRRFFRDHRNTFKKRGHRTKIILKNGKSRMARR